MHIYSSPRLAHRVRPGGDAVDMGGIFAEIGVGAWTAREAAALFGQVRHRIESEAVDPISRSQKVATFFISSRTAAEV